MRFTEREVSDGQLTLDDHRDLVRLVALGISDAFRWGFDPPFVGDRDHRPHRQSADWTANRIAGVALLSLAVFFAPSAVHGRTLPPAWVAFTRAWAGITRYSATVTLFERKGAQVQDMIVDYTFHKPSNATMRVIQGPNAGATLVWNGGTTAAAHRGSGLMAQFKRTFPLHDPQATTIRGSAIDQLSFGAILAHVQNTPVKATQASGPVIDGVATDAVTVVPTTAASSAGLTREVVEISKTTHFPVRMLGYVGVTLVQKIDFSKVRLER
jgi:outer membrane lipoprotein-sorting protein